MARDSNGNLVAHGRYTVTAYKAWNFDAHESLDGVSFQEPANAAGCRLAR